MKLASSHKCYVPVWFVLLGFAIECACDGFKFPPSMGRTLEMEFAIVHVSIHVRNLVKLKTDWKNLQQ